MPRPALALASAFALLATPVALPAGAADLDAVRDVIERAETDFRLILTCSATLTSSGPFLANAWAREVQDSLPLLAEAGLPKDEIDALSALADAEKLRLAPDTPFGEVIEFCNSDPDWEKKVQVLKFTMLHSELQRLLGK